MKAEPFRQANKWMNVFTVITLVIILVYKHATPDLNDMTNDQLALSLSALMFAIASYTFKIIAQSLE